MSDDQYIAGTDLYQRGRIRFRAGEPVPSDAFPPPAMASLRANGGLRAFRAESATRPRELITTVPPEPEAETPSGAPGPPFDPRDLAGQDLRDLIRSLEDPSGLEAVEELERAHPDHVGGRTSVLNEVEAQRQRLLEGDHG